MHVFLANGYKGIKALTLLNPLEGYVIVETGQKFGNDNNLVEYVVWYISREWDAEDFDAYYGHYTLDWDSAVVNYQSRVNQYKPTLKVQTEA